MELVQIKKNNDELFQGIIGIEELSLKELEEIDGGKNPMEYIAEGIGWVSGKIHNAWDEFKSGWDSVKCGC